MNYLVLLLSLIFASLACFVGLNAVDSNNSISIAADNYPRFGTATFVSNPFNDEFKKSTNEQNNNNYDYQRTIVRDSTIDEAKRRLEQLQNFKLLEKFED